MKKTAPAWDALALKLLAARRTARAEKRLHGRALPATLRKIDELIAQTQAAIVIDDAMNRKTPS